MGLISRLFGNVPLPQIQPRGKLDKPKMRVPKPKRRVPTAPFVIYERGHEDTARRLLDAKDGHMVRIDDETMRLVWPKYPPT